MLSAFRAGLRSWIIVPARVLLVSDLLEFCALVRMNCMERKNVDVDACCAVSKRCAGVDRHARQRLHRFWVDLIVGNVCLLSIGFQSIPQYVERGGAAVAGV